MIARGSSIKVKDMLCSAAPSCTALLRLCSHHHNMASSHTGNSARVRDRDEHGSVEGFLHPMPSLSAAAPAHGGRCLGPARGRRCASCWLGLDGHVRFMP